jgi:hypothetical protein
MGLPAGRPTHEPRDARVARAVANRWRSEHDARVAGHTRTTTEVGARRRKVPWESLLLVLIALGTAAAVVVAILNPQ